MYILTSPLRSSFAAVAAISVCGIAAAAQNPNPKEGLRDFRSPDGKFTVRLPGQPREQEQPVSTTAGAVMLRSYTVNLGSRAFLVSYADYPEKAVDATNPTLILNGARDGMLNQIRARRLSERKVRVQGNYGRSVEADLTGSGGMELRASVRIVLAKNRIYQLIAITPTAEAGAAEVKEFLESLRIE